MRKLIYTRVILPDDQNKNVCIYGLLIAERGKCKVSLSSMSGQGRIYKVEGKKSWEVKIHEWLGTSYKERIITLEELPGCEI